MSQPQMTQVNYIEHPKITSQQRQRLAYIYVRQSTLKQVYENQESRVYQYHLKQRAFELGWPEERIRIIDSDLGVSGREATAREGFQTLVAEVSLGHVGIVFGYEVSRLARNNYDWYHLLDLAAIFGTLIADSDGIYDPRLYNWTFDIVKRTQLWLSHASTFLIEHSSRFQSLLACCWLLTTTL